MNTICRTLWHAFFLIAFFIFYCCYSYAQFSSGPRSGSVFTDDNVIGVYSFGSTGNTATSDDNRASASAILSILSGNTHYLKATGFGFSIPPSGVIKGITVEVEKSAVGINILAFVEDNSIRLVKGGTIVGNNYANGSNWSSTEAYHTYGGSTNMWGTTWTAAEINSANFGVVFSAGITGIAALLPSARIDHIRITVHYDFIVVPLRIIDLQGKAISNHSAKIQWTVAGNNEDIQFAIQRSADGTEWTDIGVLPAEVNTSNKTYEYIDNDCRDRHAYYRLRIKYSSGKVEYSSVVDINFQGGSFSVYPNPAQEYVYIQSAADKKIVECFSVDGRKWILNCTLINEDQLKADISQLPRGTYIIRVNDKRRLIVKN